NEPFLPYSVHSRTREIAQAAIVAFRDTAAGRRRPRREAQTSPGFPRTGPYRTDALIEEVQQKRVLWSRSARGFYPPKARAAACEQVANAMNGRFPDLRSWDAFEVEFHWRTLFQCQYA
ncbi:hypothetical protein AAVH_38563, partial [Aphelenchoides avenae]